MPSKNIEIDDDDRETRPYQVPEAGESDDPNEGEGSRSAARLYNQHAAQYASNPDRVRRAAMAAERLEADADKGNGNGSGKQSRTKKSDDDHGVEVRFDGQHWCVTHSTLDHALQFSNLDDAEHRASELGRESGDGVAVYDQAGTMLASYTLEH